LVLVLELDLVLVLVLDLVLVSVSISMLVLVLVFSSSDAFPFHFHFISFISRLVPPSVLAQATVAAEIEEMRQYFKAWYTQNVTLRDYRPYFKAVCERTRCIAMLLVWIGFLSLFVCLFLFFLPEFGESN
jgi:hypothetical protein